MTAEEYEELIDETFEHLEQGRYRMALTSAKKVYEEFPEDHKASICLAWALMENGNSEEALELANLSVRLSDNDITARTYRGYLLTRMSLYEGALSDLNYVLENHTPLLGLALKSKARVLAASGKFDEAIEVLRTGLKLNSELEDSFKFLLSLLQLALKNENTEQPEKTLSDKADEAFRYKEYWFSLFAAQLVQKSAVLKSDHRKALFMEIDSLFHMFKIKEALEKAESVKPSYLDDADYNKIYSNLLKSNSEGKIVTPVEKKKLDGLTNLILYPETIYNVHTAKTYNLLDQLHNEKRMYLLQFNEENIEYIGVEIVIDNPFYKKRTIDIDGMAVWFLDNMEVGRNRFLLTLEEKWKTVEFMQNWGTSAEGFWTKGQGQVDIYLEEKRICTRYFLIGNTQIINFEQDKLLAVPDSPIIDEELLRKSLEELNNLIGLESVKKEIHQIVKLSRFFIEQGENPASKFQSHFVFMGNPGTGKTTVARLFSKIYCALGILPGGHLVETDRQGLIGVYVGETAQKTAEIIKKSIGGTLFIDEAYTLSRDSSSSSNDFGNEAIEILLKRMEDERGNFLVIAAGYTNQMNSFLESNPGLQSRFTKKIVFDDFSPAGAV